MLFNVKFQDYSIVPFSETFPGSRPGNFQFYFGVCAYCFTLYAAAIPELL